MRSVHQSTNLVNLWIRAFIHFFTPASLVVCISKNKVPYVNSAKSKGIAATDQMRFIRSCRLMSPSNLTLNGWRGWACCAKWIDFTDYTDPEGDKIREPSSLLKRRAAQQSSSELTPAVLLKFSIRVSIWKENSVSIIVPHFPTLWQNPLSIFWEAVHTFDYH